MNVVQKEQFSCSWREMLFVALRFLYLDLLMKTILALLLTVLVGSSVWAQDAWTDKTRALPDKLRKVPVALYIRHTPNPNYPEPNNTGDNKKSKYVWKHATSITSPEMELTVIEAGSFIWYDETGWKANVQYDLKDFQKRFKCKGGLLKAGKWYTFEENYRFGSQLYGGDALWFVLAKDAEGNIYKGMALLETEAEVINE